MSLKALAKHALKINAHSLFKVMAPVMLYDDAVGLKLW